MTAKDEPLGNLQNALRALQAKRKFLSIAVYEIRGEYAERVAAEGVACGQCNRIHLSSGNVGAVARTGEPHISSDVRSDPQYRGCFQGVRSEVVMPVKHSGIVLGIIDVEADADTIDAAEIRHFADEVLKFLFLKRSSTDG
jgi:putative methionine-R-sulfoxide reductase with GAF domain